MDLDSFKNSLAEEAPPPNLSRALQALWHDAKGNWDIAHKLIQDRDDQIAALIHAYLHRKEGDTSNAAYWYRRANRPMITGPLDAEWESLAQTLLSQSR